MVLANEKSTVQGSASHNLNASDTCIFSFTKKYWSNDFLAQKANIICQSWIDTACSDQKYFSKHMWVCKIDFINKMPLLCSNRWNVHILSSNLPSFLFCFRYLLGVFHSFYAEGPERGVPWWLLKLRWMGTQRVQIKGGSFLVCS